MSNVFNNLNLKWWHTVLLIASFSIFVLSLTVDMKVSSNETIAFLSSGIFFISLGSFSNQSFQTAIHHGYTTRRDRYKFTWSGAIFILLGIFLLYKGF